MCKSARFCLRESRLAPRPAVSSTRPKLWSQGGKKCDKQIKKVEEKERESLRRSVSGNLVIPSNALCNCSCSYFNLAFFINLLFPLHNSALLSRACKLTHTHRAEKWGLAVRLSVSAAFSSHHYTCANAYRARRGPCRASVSELWSGYH